MELNTCSERPSTSSGRTVLFIGSLTIYRNIHGSGEAGLVSAPLLRLLRLVKASLTTLVDKPRKHDFAFPMKAAGYFWHAGGVINCATLL